MLQSRINALLEDPDALLVIERAQAILADESKHRWVKAIFDKKVNRNMLQKILAG